MYFEVANLLLEQAARNRLNKLKTTFSCAWKSDGLAACRSFFILFSK